MKEVFYGIVILILLLVSLYLVWNWNWKKPIKKKTKVNTNIIKSEIQKAEANHVNLTADQLYALAETYHYGRYGKEVDLGRAIRLYEESTKKARDVGHSGTCNLAIGRLYKDGGGGHVPEGRKAIRYFIKALECGHEDAILEIGKIYMHGLHPNYLPDKLTVGKIYNRISYDQRFSERLRRICSGHAKEISKLGYQDLDNIPESGREYFTLPYTILEDISNAWESCMIRKIPIVQCSTDVPVVSARSQVAPVQRIEEDLQEALWNDMQTRRDTTANINILDLLPQHNVKSDSQNVHSSTVQNAVKGKLEAIEQRGHVNPDFEKNKRDFLSAIGDMDDRENASRVLDSLKDSVHSRYNKKETDIFNIVWSRINNPVNKDRRGDMISVLCQNMASGIEHDAVVCSTGKVVRMVGALDAMDAEPLPELRPEWAINAEISQAAAKIREEVLGKASPNERDAYEAVEPTEAQKQMAVGVTQKMREELVAKCDRDYVQKDIVSTEDMEMKLTDYLESF